MSERIETMDRDALVDELYARLAAVAETEDPAPVLHPVVPGLARALAAHLTAHSGGWTDADVFALTVLVMVHSIRLKGLSEALPPGENEEDTRACLAWARVLLPIAPEAVPDHIGQYLREQDRIDAADQATIRGLYQLTEYRQTGQLGHLQAAVDQFREAAAAMPDWYAGRPRVLVSCAVNGAGH